MVKMVQVYAFPEKKKLPKRIEERLHDVAKQYVGVLKATCILLGTEGTDQMTYEEILDLVTRTYVEGIELAIEELD